MKSVLKNTFFLALTVSTVLTLAAKSLQASEAWDHAIKTGELRWGADAAGGAPYFFPNPEHPDQMVGFEMEIMEAAAKHLGLKSVPVNVQWDQLVPALLRGDFDIAFNGLEITEDRKQAIDFTHPYYYFAEQITVRRGGAQFKHLEDLLSRRVGTLSASLAQNILEKKGGIAVVPYPSPVEAYKDLEIGRIDAALLDVPIAAYYVSQNPALENTGEPIGEGIYAGGVRKDSPVLLEKINTALRQMIASGELEAIYRKWNLWNKNQEKLQTTASGAEEKIRPQTDFSKYFKLLLKGAGMTLLLSLLSMALASLTGFGLCLSKLYGPRPLKILSNIYIEITRGTPLLIQLFVIYYGLPNIGIHLSAFTAAVLGVGLNYAAYEAEIYRAGLLSIPKGQDEAARSLGMSGWQSLRFVILPQALRTILPPSTNDFVALFKDTSLVSIITVTELTRAYTQAANSTYRFLELGLMTALLYFLMSFPLSLWSRQMEKSRNVFVH